MKAEDGAVLEGSAGVGMRSKALVSSVRTCIGRKIATACNDGQVVLSRACNDVAYERLLLSCVEACCCPTAPPNRKIPSAARIRKLTAHDGILEFFGPADSFLPSRIIKCPPF